MGYDDIVGDVNGDRFGISVAVSTSGETGVIVAISAPGYNKNQ